MKNTTAVMALAMVMTTGLGLAEDSTQKTAMEIAAWQSATRTGTPAAFADYFKKYPASPRITTRTGTLRGRYWFKINDPDHQDGVIVTVEGTDLLVNVSLEEAKTLEVMHFRPAPAGIKSSPEGRTFNYVYCEIIEGGFIVAKMVDNKLFYELVAPRDNLNSTVVLSADGKRLLTWDLRHAQAAKRPNAKPTFVAGAAAVPPFKNVPAGISRKFTPESQGVIFDQTRQE